MGEAWAQKSTTSAVHTNGANEVRFWKPDGDGSTFYAANSLLMEEVTNAEGKKLQSFSDKSGRRVLTRQQLGETVDGVSVPWLETYYVYDEAGRLKYQVPPQAVVELQKASTQTWKLNTDPAFISKWVFSYVYDDLGRLAQKQVPGAQAQYLVYDKADRLIMTQDGKQRAANKWYYNKYDDLGRLTEEGLYSAGSTLSQAQMQSQATAASGYAFPSINLELLVKNLYDSYGFIAGQSLYAYDNADAAGLSKTEKTFGMLTGKEIKVIDASSPLTLKQVFYYDEFGRVVQTVADNILGGLDRRTSVFDFEGKTVQSFARHSTPAATVKVENKQKYDHAGRLLEVRQTSIEDPSLPVQEVILGQYQYNELGQLVEKDMHAKVTPPAGPGMMETLEDPFLQSVDFRYDINGRLRRINGSELGMTGINQGDAINDLFGLEILYEGQDQGLGNIGRWDGLVSGVKWKVKDQNPNLTATARQIGQRERSYRMEYDAIGRMKGAFYKARNSDGTPWTEEAGGYDEKNLTYDANGNMRTLDRYSWAAGGTGPTKIDGLTYLYSTSSNPAAPAGNRLVQVVDNATTGGTTPVGFKNGASLATEYTYDENGSQLQDYNKGINLSYNILNKVKEAVAGTDKATYVYDATGNVVQRVVKVGANTQTTSYANGFVYERTNTGGDALAYYPTAEGRRVKRNGSFYYEYFLKDHQGNVRLTFSPGDNENGTVTMEQMAAPEEEEEFSNVAETRHLDAAHAYNGKASARLNARIGKPIGPRKWLTVQAGDSISTDVYAHYVRPARPQGFVFSLIGFLLGNATVEVKDRRQDGAVQKGKNKITPYLGVGTGLALAPLVQHKAEEGVPKAYLRILVYDQDSNFVKSFERPITKEAKGGWENLALHYRAEQKGFVEVMVVNEGEEDVFFDAMRVGQLVPMVTQENHYYPFGMKLQGIAAGVLESPENPNRNLYNGGVELQDFTQTYGTHYRHYDPVLGRFQGVDPLADQFGSWNPYQFGYNSPVSFNDPLGDLVTNNVYNGRLVNARDDLGRRHWENSPDGQAAAMLFAGEGNDMNLISLGFIDRSEVPTTQEYLRDKLLTNPGKTFARDENNNWRELIISTEFSSYTEGNGWINNGAGGEYYFEGRTQYYATQTTSMKTLTNLRIQGSGWSTFFKNSNTTLGVGGVLYGGLELTMSNKYFWTNAKGDFQSTKILEKGLNGKYVRGVQGFRNGQNSAIKVARNFKVAGLALSAVSAGVTIGLAVNYYSNGGVGHDVMLKAGLDLAMAGVGLMGPIGFGISTAYFIADTAGVFGDWGDPTKLK
ncbi:hypothetical protein GU926_11140 [Nibribacter ruber]|uniref:RHS repeat-associated core domain-containing protein n=1 Tax=Nibribacter ruber TaxID=2698458 RepID=A0A6P1NZM3_9BACT|nr:hypothetical protein GU926_11140 [Nibribacter ruber]